MNAGGGPRVARGVHGTREKARLIPRGLGSDGGAGLAWETGWRKEGVSEEIFGVGEEEGG